MQRVPADWIDGHFWYARAWEQLCSDRALRKRVANSHPEEKERDAKLLPFPNSTTLMSDNVTPRDIARESGFSVCFSCTHNCVLSDAQLSFLDVGSSGASGRHRGGLLLPLVGARELRELRQFLLLELSCRLR